jgi:hypothetical protein
MDEVVEQFARQKRDVEDALEQNQFDLKSAEDDMIVIGEYKEELEKELGDTKCEDIIDMPEMGDGMMMDQGMMDATGGMMESMLPPPPANDGQERTDEEQAKVDLCYNVLVESFRHMDA